MKPSSPAGRAGVPDEHKPYVDDRVRREAEAVIAEHAAAKDPDRIDTLAQRRLMLFSEGAPQAVDLMVVDALRARAATIRAQRLC
jgi:hypothetical protein